ncbi:uncharacterized protein VP01_2953g3 [Puccinia sorghi]|uniref:Uncharacterized protein n=1 Tax=Puccinia sorghi TaxID=27349 RepID=A0A0L6V0Z0_9BASI|nr:uncharacterized protein VP01_2953g3 [Puccinia sorghi]
MHARRVFTAASVCFDKAPVIHAAYSMEAMDDIEAVVDAIECLGLGNFRLGDALDGQDAAVKVMESRDPYGSDSPSYEEVVQSIFWCCVGRWVVSIWGIGCGIFL